MQHSATLRRTVLETYAALNRNDGPAIADRFGGDPEARTVGIGEDDWHRGGERIVAALAEQAEAMPGLSLEPGEIEAFEEGPVGWFADRPTMRCPGSPPAAARLTGTAVRTDGGWRVVQSHLSLPRTGEV
jgi:hypothetical protein